MLSHKQSYVLSLLSLIATTAALVIHPQMYCATSGHPFPLEFLPSSFSHFYFVSCVCPCPPVSSCVEIVRASKIGGEALNFKTDMDSILSLKKLEYLVKKDDFPVF